MESASRGERVELPAGKYDIGRLVPDAASLEKPPMTIEAVAVPALLDRRLPGDGAENRLMCRATA